MSLPRCCNFCIALLFLSAIIQAVYRFINLYNFSRKNKCKAAQSKVPLKDPFIGLDFIYNCIFGTKSLSSLRSAHDLFVEWGSTYTAERWTWKTIYTNDCRNVKQILATSFNDFDLPQVRTSAMASLLGDGIFALNGESWSHFRDAMRHFFAKQNKSALLGSLERHFEALMPHLSVTGRIVDVQPLFHRLTMDFATEILMGRSTNLLAQSSKWDEREQFVDDYLTCSTEVVTKMNLGPLRHFRINLKAWKAKRGMFRFIDSFIRESMNSQDQPGEVSSMLRDLAAASDTHEQLRSQVLHILVASRDTTASLLSNLFHVLSQDANIYDKLRRSVLGVVATSPPSVSELKQMEYLKWCIQESLRLHPVIPTNAREAIRDTTLPCGGGKDGNSPLLVKRGTIVIYNIYSMHRDEHAFGTKPEEFIPERWTNIRPGWGYLPFNGGPRICIGQQFALLEVQYLVARIVQRFEGMENESRDPWVENYALATTCKNGLRVRLTKS